MKINDAINALELWAKKKYIESWDKAGFHVGNGESPLTGILIAMDITDTVVQRAITENKNLIITHHPFIFSPIDSIITSDYRGGLISLMMKNDISVYSLHTNLDLAEGGVNDVLADLFEIMDRESLGDFIYEKLYKLAVYVPLENQYDILEALSNEDAGIIGNYRDCSFTTKGVGRFVPLKGANPFIGNENKLEEVNEVKIEALVREENLNGTIKAILSAHPYEEVAYDVIPLGNKFNGLGYGRVGNIEPISLEKFIDKVKSNLGLDHINVFGVTDKPVSRIAFCGGGGIEFLKDAKDKGAQVYITGDCKYHDGQHAYELGMVLIDGTHYATEFPVLYKVRDYLLKTLNEVIEISVFDEKPFPVQTY